MTGFIRFRKTITVFLLQISYLAGAQDNALVSFIGEKQGFSEPTVYAILKDHLGFMWFGCSDGLWRYDGYNFKKYAHEPGNANSLSSSFVTTLLEDRRGNLWVGTLDAGLNKFNPATNTFTQFVHDDQDSSTAFRNYITEIAEDAHGSIWFCATKLHQLDTATNKITRFDLPDASQQIVLSSICLDDEGTFWIGSSGDGLFRFDPNTGKFTPYDYTHGDETIRVRSKVIRRIIDDKQGNLWIGSYGGLIRFEKKSGKTTHWIHDDADPESINHNSIWDLARAGNQLFISTWGGGFSIMDIAHNKFESNLFKPGGVYNLKSVEMPSLYFDHGRFWLGTNGQGIYHFKTLPGLTLIQSQEAFRGREIRRISKQPKFTYFTGIEGLIAYSDDHGIAFTLPAAADKKKNSLSGNRVSMVCEDQKGNVFIGTEEGLTQYQIHTGKIIYYRNDPNDSTSLRQNSILSIYCDQNDNLWVGTAFGLDLLNSGTKRFFHISKRRVKANQVSAITETPEGMWIGSTTSGLYFMSRDGKSDVQYQYDEKNHRGIGNNSVTNLLPDDGSLYVGTRNGLQRLDIKTGIFTKVPLPMTLTNQGVISWSKSKSNRFYLHTPNNLAIVDPTGNTPVNIVSIFSGDIHSGMHWSPLENRLYIFAEKNAAYVPIDSIQSNSVVPRLAITDFLLDYNNKHPLDSVRQRESPTHWKEIVLDYDQNLFSIEFASLDYAKPEDNQHAYRLVGFDNDWTFSGSRRFATYTNLSPGTYTFRVKGSNNDGVWNEEGTSLIIKILPPPWKTWWAYMVYVLLFMWLLWMGRRAVIHRERLQAQVLIEKNENRTLQELDLLKTRFFSNITHEFRTPLTLIQGSADEMLGKVKDPQEVQFMRMIRSNSDRLLKLINQMLDLARFDAQEMKLKNKPIALKNFLRRSVSQFSSMAESKGIRFEWTVADDLPDAIADEEKLEVVFTNLISNALKFTKREGEVHVSVDWSNRNLLFVIRDTGRGIPSENLKHIFNRFYQVSPTDSSHSEGTGIGLALVKEYVELMKGEIQVESIEGSGTTFHVQLPLEITNAVKINSPQEVLGQSAVLSVPIENGSAPVILIVEDNEDIRNFIRICLGKEFHFVEAQNGKEGFELALKQVPDIIISDLMMPEMDGMELCEAVKHDGRTDHIPFIMLTAKATEEDKIEGLQTGADDYLVKPFNKTELALKVRHLILLREKLQAKLRAELLTQASPLEAVSASELFLVRVRTYIEKNLNNEDLSVEMLAEALGLSREQCYRKISALTSLSPSALIRKLRLQKAAQLLASQWGPVSQVAYEVGFGNLSHFSKSFKEEFGQLPSEYIHP